MKNLWICPECGKEVDYGVNEPSDGKTWCSETNKTVRMERAETWKAAENSEKK